MNPRKKIIAANWKMFKDLAEANEFFKLLIEKIPNTKTQLLIAPSFTNLWHAFEATREFPVEIIAQNVHQENQGAFTGEISAAMLKSVGIKTVIIGHSERREYFGEDDTLLKAKVKTALKNDMKVIFCIGEKLEQRKANTHFNLVKNQLQSALFDLEKSDWNQIVLAYEPVWAIGTGETASPEQAQEMHLFIRKEIVAKFGEEIANQISILYGGSVKPNNAKSLFSQPDIDGGLVGGASLEVDSFIDIIKAV